MLRKISTTHQCSPVLLDGVALPTRLGGALGLGLRVVVVSLGLEEDAVVDVAPEVSHRVAAVAATHDQLQTARAGGVRARFTCKHINRE